MKTIVRFGGKKLIALLLVILGISTILFLNIPYFETFTSDEIVNYTRIRTVIPSELKDKNLTAKNLPVEIFAKDNFKDYQVHFILPRDTFITINAVGEAASYSHNPYLFKSYDNDGIEVYFDMKNEKTAIFDLNKDDRQYRFLWKTLNIDGQNINKAGVKVSELDPSNNRYIMEITFPWKSLGYITPKVNAKIGFDISLIDSDGGTMKSELNWHSKSEDSWKNTSYYGTMLLVNNHRTYSDSNFVYANKRTRHRKINHFSYYSQKPLFYKFKNVTIGYVTDSLDLSGKFKADWDENNLYITVYVRDNIKSVAQALFDLGWIENTKGKTIWKMNMSELKPAGGALKNQREDTVLFLKRGNYILKYHTDESHAPSKWDDQPPSTEFYGIRLSYQNKQRKN